MSYNVTPRGDIRKLPKWAKDYIEGLTREIERQDDHIKEISSEHPGSNVILDSTHIRPDVTLPPDSRVRFYMGDSRESFDESIEINHHRNDPSLLRVSGYGRGRFLVIPHVSNVVFLKLEGI